MRLSGDSSLLMLSGFAAMTGTVAADTPGMTTLDTADTSILSGFAAMTGTVAADTTDMTNFDN
jgi:hypothetical protein